MRCLSIILLIITDIFAIAGTEGSFLSEQEEYLAREYEELMALQPEKRHEAADIFYDHFINCIQNDSSFNYAFSKLSNIGKIYSGDNLMRIYTWNIPVNLNENSYYGVVQYHSKPQKKNLIYLLNKSGDNILLPPDQKWESKLYYKAIETRHDGRRYYTLLGYDMNTPLSNKKSVEVIYFDENENLVFCHDKIKVNQKLVPKLVFEYNEKAAMGLQYNEKMKMIVFDHLSPSKPSLTGQYEFYGPDFTYDGLRWEDGVWNYLEKIDVTN